jgi:hypothetical protein
MFLQLLRENFTTVPCGATQQTFPYPRTAHRFDLMIFHGDTTEFVINEAEKQLFSLMKSLTIIDGYYISLI